jgi:hypothetical protein
MANASASCDLNPAIPRDLTKFKRHSSWVCNARILVTSTNNNIKGAIAEAIPIWNAVFGHNNLPEFVTTGQADFTVNVAFATGESGPYYCGTTLQGTSRDITINRSDSPTECGGATSSNPVNGADLDKIIAHELSHAIGFGHLSENGTRPAADHCVASLPAAGGLNSRLCQLEILQLQYYYGLSDILVQPTTYIAGGLEVTGQTTANPGQSKTLTAFPQWDGAAPTTTVRYAWTTSNASVAQVSSSTTATNLVQAVSPGVATIHARITSSNVLVLDAQSGDAFFTVTGAPPPPPTGLNVDPASITATSATVRWTNTAQGASTNLYYGLSSNGPWTGPVTNPAGATSAQLSSLASLTTYHVRAQHVLGGQSSAFTSTVPFTTAAAPPPPPPTVTNFRVLGCRQQVTGGKTFNYFTMVWDASPHQTTGSYQIGMHTANSPGSASVVLTVPGTSETGEVGGYLSGPTTSNRYFWVRYIRNGAPTTWVALTGNPLKINQCLL